MCGEQLPGPGDAPSAPAALRADFFKAADLAVQPDWIRASTWERVVDALAGIAERWIAGLTAERDSARDRANALRCELADVKLRRDDARAGRQDAEQRADRAEAERDAVRHDRDRYAQALRELVTITDRWQETGLPQLSTSAAAQVVRGVARAVLGDAAVTPADAPPATCPLACAEQHMYDGGCLLDPTVFPDDTGAISQGTGPTRDGWAWRCWGTDTCDGWLSFGHPSAAAARRAYDRHVQRHHGPDGLVPAPMLPPLADPPAPRTRHLLAEIEQDEDQAAADDCTIHDVDGDPVLIRGSGPLTAADRTAMLEVIRAARRRYAAEHQVGDEESGEQPP
jgi:hypothetical protein